MIFHRSLLREFAATGTATFIVLLAITITTQLIRFLGYAARGNISSDAVLTFLGFASLRYLPILLSLTLFISVLIDADAQLPRFGNGGVVHFRAGIERLDPSGIDLCRAADIRDRSPEPAAVALGDGQDRRVPPSARDPGRCSRDFAGRVQGIPQ